MAVPVARPESKAAFIEPMLLQRMERLAGQLGLEGTPAKYATRLVEISAKCIEYSDRMGRCGSTWRPRAAGKVGKHPGGGTQRELWAVRGYRGAVGNEPQSAALGPMIQPNRMPLP